MHCPGWPTLRERRWRICLSLSSFAVNRFWFRGEFAQIKCFTSRRRAIRVLPLCLQFSEPPPFPPCPPALLASAKHLLLPLPLSLLRSGLSSLPALTSFRCQLSYSIVDPKNHQSVNRGVGSGEILRGSSCIPHLSSQARLPMPHLSGLWAQWVQVTFKIISSYSQPHHSQRVEDPLCKNPLCENTLCVLQWLFLHWYC